MATLETRLMYIQQTSLCHQQKDIVNLGMLAFAKYFTLEAIRAATCVTWLILAGLGIILIGTYNNSLQHLLKLTVNTLPFNSSEHCLN